jgi:hypothetical protein
MEKDSSNKTRASFKKSKINEEVVELLVVIDLLEKALLVMLEKELNSLFVPSFLSPSCEHLLS